MKRISSFPPCLSFLLYLVLTGCGGGSNASTQQGPPIPFFSGLYQITGASNSNASSNFTLAGSLMQSGNSVSGVMHITLPACFSFSTDIPVAGTLENTADLAVTLTLTLPDGQNLSFSLNHPGGHLSSITGSYTLSGAGCAAPDQGLASGNIMSVTGSSWVGTLVSTGGTTSHISLALTQTGPDAHGFFSATGTATITGGTCFSGASVDPASVVIGAGSQLIMDNSQVGTAGKLALQGTFTPLPFGGATFAGAYTSTQGACTDTGTVSMTFS
jgi:hypothetical protein